MIRLVSIFSFCLLFLLPARSVNAQVATGMPPFGSYGGGPDVINLANLNSHISIPVLHKAGRGTNFTYDLSYDSSVWYPVGASGTQVWTPVTNWGWRGVTEVATGYISYTATTVPWCQNMGQQTTLSNWIYHDQFGISHPFVGSNYVQRGAANCNPQSTNLNAVSGDGSGATLTARGQTGTITYTNGQVITAPINLTNGAAVATDRNGNQINVNASGQFFDTLSNVTPVLTASGLGTASSPLTFTYSAPSAASAVYTVKYSTLKVQTNFGCSSITDYGTNGTTTVDLVTEIDLPDQGVNANDRYIFTYENTPNKTGYVTGRVASIQLPTGGTITYKYTGGSSGNITCADGSTAGLQRTTPDTGTSVHWNYARTAGTGAAYTTTITDPTTSANQTVIQFQGLYETERQVYQGSTTGTLLATTNTCYNAAISPCNSTAIVPPLTQRSVTTTLPGNLVSNHLDSFNTYGMPTETDDYDYGTGAPGALLRKILYTYASLGNITAFRQQVTVQNGSGTFSQTNYNYDQTGVTATSGTLQHTSAPSSRGNLTSVNYYTNGTTYLTASSTYYDTGNLLNTTDVNGGVTTYAYGTGLASCYNSFPTGITEAISALTKSMTWNCTGGVETSVTDENTKVTSISYTTDHYFWRPDSTTDSTSAQTNFSYPGPAQVESTLTISGTSTADALVTLDNQGRPLLTQIKQGPSLTSYDTVETDYDIAGRPTKSTIPFSGSAGLTNSSAYGATTSYDALNRPLQVMDSGGGTTTYSYSKNDVYVSVASPTGENAKRRQLEYDALGRLTSVCEVTALAGSGTCGQSTTVTGYWTKYSYNPLGQLTGVTQNAQSGSTQSRSFAYDFMGRMTSETHAESGTTSYIYDTDATCLTSKGDKVKRTDAVGNVTCYSYDLLHRVTTITYPSGSYAANTGQKHYVYDSATVNSVAMTNAKNRVAEAYTCLSPCSTKITDLGMSYTARGETSDIYQSSPNSAGYYHAVLQYWPNGATKQVSGLPTLPTFNYGLDGEGRIATMSASTGQNPLTNTTYNSAGLPTALTFGSSDTDAFTYDPTTFRVTKYQFNVNAQSFVGNLTWNANGTLATQNTTDPFNATDTQNCSYSHDDLVRISAANCGSTWSQTFSYDAFGNLSKNGNLMFQPTYSPSTNRMTAIGSFTPSYDANGNVLNDGTHVYTWDAEGKYLSVDGANVIYDALGRMVEIAYPSEVFYLPDGSSILFKGQVARQAEFKLPGGAKAEYDSTQGGLFAYYHPDHLGSIRLISTPTRTFSSSLAYAPFGEVYSQSSPGSSQEFTGVGQGFNLDIYEFPAREYNERGRWASPDPAGLAAADGSNPQSWNRYAYVGNNPLSRTDPTGLHYYDCDWYGGCNAPTGGGGSGYYGGGPGGCSLDGVQTACSNLTGLGSNGIAPCPNNFCGGFNNGVYMQYTADANANGFYSCLTGGSFATQQQAGIAAVGCASGISGYYNREYSGNIYQNDNNGTFSFTLPGGGTDVASPFDTTNIPDYTEFAGDYHTHVVVPGYYAEQFSAQGCVPGQLCDIGNANRFNNGNPMFLGTPQGRVEVYYPNLFFIEPYGCVLVGASVSPGSGSLVSVPRCF